MTLLQRLGVGAQYVVPQRLLTDLLNWLARIQTPWFKNAFIRLMIRWFHIDLSDATTGDIRQYESFNAFFVRALRPDSRPMAPPPAIASPVDGTISAIGKIQETQIFQAKGKHYSLNSLLARTEALTDKFAGGSFATLYLAPYNYHRIHIPCTGTLTHMHCVPGKLFSVNATSVNGIENLFARNERVISIFNSEVVGNFAVIKVGALNVGSIETVWDGVVTPSKKIRRQNYTNGSTFSQGEEIARFNFGSTVILLFPKDTIEWDETLHAGTTVKLGQSLGQTVV